jgi:hypothetical protein
MNNYMLRRNRVLSFVLIIVFVSCKKNSDPVPVSDPIIQLDASGIWSTSYLSNTANGFLATASEFPCLANAKLILNKDSTALRIYTGTDTCYMSKTPLYILGLPDAGTPGTWSQNGNSVTIRIQGLSKPGLGVISTTSTGFQLKIQDSVVNSVALTVMIK